MSSSSKYAAFISYRHISRDAEVAKQVQHAIETYVLPKGLRLAVEIPAKGSGGKTLGQCFRDEDELAAAHSLPERITEALQSSSAMVVVCSPEACESAWVQREIEAFIEAHGRERVFCVLAAGDSKTSIPEILRYKTVRDVDGVERRIPVEPLAADFRPSVTAKLADEKLRLIAALAGCGFDDLRQRARARKRRRAGVGVAAALALLGTVGGFALNAHNSQQNALAEESRTLAARSQQLYAQGDRYGAIEAALQALPASEADTSRPLVPEAQTALEAALQVQPSEDLWLPCYSLLIDEMGILVANENEKELGFVLNDKLETLFYDIETGKSLGMANLDPLGDFLDSRGLIINRELGLSLAREYAGDSDALDIAAGGGRFFVCSCESFPEDNWDEPYSWKLQAFNNSGTPLWEYEDTSIVEASLSLRVNGSLGYLGLPHIASSSEEVGALIIVVRNRAIVFDMETGEKLNELIYPMPIVSASWFTHKSNSEMDMLYAACADGSVLWKNPFDSAYFGEGFSSKFQLPGYITQAVFVLLDNGNLYLAVFDEPTADTDLLDSGTTTEQKSVSRVRVYKSNQGSSVATAGQTYSLDELVSLAHETLSAAGR